MQKYLDRENYSIITEKQLKAEYEAIKADGGTDAQRLLDILQALGEVTITAAAGNPTVSGLYLNSNIGDAILMPIKK